MWICTWTGWWDRLVGFKQNIGFMAQGEQRVLDKAGRVYPFKDPSQHVLVCTHPLPPLLSPGLQLPTLSPLYPCHICRVNGKPYQHLPVLDYCFSPAVTTCILCRAELLSNVILL